MATSSCSETAKLSSELAADVQGTSTPNTRQSRAAMTAAALLTVGVRHGNTVVSSVGIRTAAVHATHAMKMSCFVIITVP